MTAWSHVIDLIGRMQAVNERVNAALDGMSRGALAVEDCRAIRDRAAVEIESLNSSLAAALSETRSQDPAQSERKAARASRLGGCANRPALLRSGRTLKLRTTRRLSPRGFAKTSV